MFLGELSRNSVFQERSNTMSYVKEDFLLNTPEAKELYFGFAKNMPIFDYHCHLSEYQILENKPFNDLYEIWLSGDHYKWRLMRNYGIDEEFITGKKPNKEKFITYCEVLSTAFGNPLYHWSQIELETFFGCKHEINKENAELIWNECNEYIKTHQIRPSDLISSSNVTHLFTTNEIFDDLEVFSKIKEKRYSFEVLPAFRADKVMNIEAQKYNEFIDILQNKTFEIKDLDSLEKAVINRLDLFIKAGCLASDTALQAVYEITTKEKAKEIFAKRRNGEVISSIEANQFKGYFTYFLLREYGKRKIVSELHIGAMRNNSQKMFDRLGLDCGNDSIAEENSIKNLSKLMDKLDLEGHLPPMIIFNLNPKMNLEIATLIGSYQDDSKRGKIQFGPAWWFLDHLKGIRNQLEDLSSVGHLGAFVGMLTDSRSFLSYPRHHYFRRILCDYLGEMMNKGLITNDIEKVGKVVEDICYNNAVKYFSVR